MAKGRDQKRGSRGLGGERRKYRRATREQLHRRATQRGSKFDSYFKPEFPVFTPKEGKYRVRLFPPTWEGAEHTGYDIFVNYGVGGENQSYLSLSKMLGDPDPIDDEWRRAEAKGDTEYAKQLLPKKRVVVWMLDRDNMKEGPQLWAMPWTVDRDIAVLLEDEDSRAAACIDDPYEGYDIHFTRQGSGVNTKYIAIKVARVETPASDDLQKLDEWLQFIEDNPVPHCLQYYSYEHINRVFAAGASTDDDDDDDDDDNETEESTRYSRRSRTEEDEYEERPRRKSDRSEQQELFEGDDDEDEAPWESDEPEDPEEERPSRRRLRQDEEDEHEERPRRRSGRGNNDEDNDEEDNTPKRRLRRLGNNRGN